mgnify:CR=1 FL=1
MKCPICKKETKVIDSRALEEGSIIRRRRSCRWCKFRFSTHEEMELLNFKIRKKGGALQSYDRNKLLEGIERSCEKRPIKQEEILKLVSSIEKKLMDRKNPVADSKVIGNLVIQQLKKIDEVAYMRFASVYKSFDSAEKFKKELINLKK